MCISELLFPISCSSNSGGVRGTSRQLLHPAAIFLVLFSLPTNMHAVYQEFCIIFKIILLRYTETVLLWHEHILSEIECLKFIPKAFHYIFPLHKYLMYAIPVFL